jgi:hypothetical protein
MFFAFFMFARHALKKGIELGFEVINVGAVGAFL